MTSKWIARAGRVMVVVAVVLFLAASGTLAGSKREESRAKQGRSPVAAVIKAQVKVIKTIAVAEAKLERQVSSSLLHTGVDIFTRALRWVSREVKVQPKPSQSRLPREL